MNAAHTKSLQMLLAASLAALVPLASAASRVLLESADSEVRMDGALRCDRDAEVTILSRDPHLFAGGSDRLQSLLDATHAVLGFECRNLPGIVVTGRLAGLESTSYQAVAGPAGDWRLRPTRTVQVSSLDGGSTAAQAAPGRAADRAARFAVRELRRGMGVDESLDAVRRSFGAEPRYHATRQLLSVVDGGCPIAGEILEREFSLRAGDSCLEAKFSGDGRMQRLDRLTLAQVVDMNQAASIRGELEQRYGRPARASQPTASSTRLDWGTRSPGPDSHYELEARIDVRDANTVLVLQLRGAEEQPRRYSVQF